MNISDEAVEAAAAAMWNLSELVRKGARPEWATLRKDPTARRHVQMAIDDARAALEAAAPYFSDKHLFNTPNPWRANEHQ